MGLGRSAIDEDILRRVPDALIGSTGAIGPYLNQLHRRFSTMQRKPTTCCKGAPSSLGWAPSYSSGKGKLMSWLCTLARRRAIDRLRQQSAYRRATDRYEVSCNVSNIEASESHTVEREASRADLRSLLHQHLVALPPNQQEVIRMAFLEEKSQREISALTHTPLGTVKTRIELGIKKLSHALGGLRERVV
jgi:RNA polymerase sigma factor (sigma-70 family)